MRSRSGCSSRSADDMHIILAQLLLLSSMRTLEVVPDGLNRSGHRRPAAGTDPRGEVGGASPDGTSSSRGADSAASRPVAEPIRLVHGLRAPGLGLPGRTKIGTWRSKGRKTFAVTHKGAPGPANHAAGQHVRRDPAVRSGFGAAWPTEISSRLTLRSATVAGATERLVTFRSAGITLAGTVLLPAAGQQVHAAAVVITGSGPARSGRQRSTRTDRRQQAARRAPGPSGRRLPAVRQARRRRIRRRLPDRRPAGQHRRRQGARWNPLPRNRNARSVPLVAIGHSEGALIAAALAAEPGSIGRRGGPAGRPGQDRRADC